MRNPSSLTVTQTITPTPLTAAPCGGGKSGGAKQWKGNRNHGLRSTRTEMATSLVTRTATEIMTGNMIGPKRAINDMVQNGLADALHNGKCSSNGKHKRSWRHESPFDSHRAKQRCRVSTSPLRGRKKSHTPEC